MAHATAGPAVICIGEFSPSARWRPILRSRFPANPRLMLITIDNSRGARPLHWILPASGSTAATVQDRGASGARRAERRKDPRDRMTSELGGDLRAEPHSSMTVGFAFLPASADLKSVRASRCSSTAGGFHVGQVPERGSEGDADPDGRRDGFAVIIILVG